jgi:hypothetical protein
MRCRLGLAVATAAAFVVGGWPITALAGLPSHTFLLGPRSKGSGCHVRGPLPDRRCSPGAIYRDATLPVICRPYYTSKVRRVSEATRAKVFREYGIPYRLYGRAYEIDHIVPLELGGSNAIANLYPEAAFRPSPGYVRKDRLENRLHDLVCARRMVLRKAQQAIASNWVMLYRQVYGQRP